MWCKIYQWPGQDDKATAHLNFVSNSGVILNLLTENKTGGIYSCNDVEAETQ